MSIRTQILDMLFPKACLSCGWEGVYLCASCANNLTYLPAIQCPACQRRLPEGKLDLACRRKTGLTRFIAALPFQDPFVTKLVHALKYQFLESLAANLGYLLAETIRQSWSEKSISLLTVLAIPLHKNRLKWRGFNQAALIAEVLAKDFNLSLLPTEGSEKVFCRKKPSKPQIGLSREKRYENVQGVFEVLDKSKIQGKKILLVDDVLTSGATMFEAAQTLKEAGAKEVWGAVVARG